MRHPPVILASAMLALALGPVGAAAASPLPQDAAWEGFLAPAVSGVPAAALGYHDKLVLIGGGHAAGHLAANGVVTWDGTQFETLPPVPTPTAQTIWNDRIVVAGGYYHGSGPHYIVSFNGATWDTLGTLDNRVNAMASHQGRLVAIGHFTTVNGDTVNRVAAFDGTNWSGFGSGLPSTAFVPGAVVDHAGTLVVGGFMPALGNVVRWDEGTNAWQTLGAGLDGQVYALATDGVNLFAAGTFGKSGATPMAGIARWDGTTWNSMGTPAGSTSLTVSMWNAKAVFGIPAGPSRLQTWDGSGLSTLPGDSLGYNLGKISAGNTILSITTWGTKLVVTGHLFRNGSTPMPGIGIFDGVQWSTIGEPWDDSMRSPVGSGITDMREWGGKLVMAGEFGLIADRDRYLTMPGIAAWDGEQWSALGDGIHGSSIVLGEYQGDLVAGSWRFFVRNATPSISNIARWNGTAWSGFGTAGPSDVTALQQFRDDLYVINDVALMRWNGSCWCPFSGDDYPNLLYALGTTSDSLIAGGDFDLTTGMPSPNVAFWNGTNWLPAGAGVNNSVFAMANWNSRVVIGGRFTASGATLLSGVAIWDGAAWQPLGGNVVEVEVLRVIDGDLFALGTFKLPDQTVTQTIAHYVGPDWELLGSGTNGVTFGGFGGYLYAGGDGIVNGHLSHGLSRAPLGALLDAPRPDPPPARLALAAAPNPATERVTLAYSLPRGGHVRLSVYDAGGRLVTRLVDGEVSAGRHTAAWATRAAPGLYFAKLDAPDGSQRVARIIRLE